MINSGEPRMTKGDLPKQDLREDSEWDAQVLGTSVGTYRQLLAGEFTKVRWPADRLAPLQQVLLANALYIGAEGKATFDLDTVGLRNAILDAGVKRLKGAEQLSLPWIQSPPGVAWITLNALYLASLTPQFDDSISVLLFQAGAAGRLSSLRRQQLNGLLFHPLQNADQHGRQKSPSRTFSGVSAQIVLHLAPETPSLIEYRRALGESFAASGDQFLELIVHDNGPGIAFHFYDATREEGNPELIELPLFHEWAKLNGAFERHATSKPKLFRRSTTRSSMPPGIGLAGMLSAAKQLRAFLELRTGRLRVFQWYREDDSIPDQNLLRPDQLPAAAGRVSGTIFRFLVPLDTDRTPKQP